MGENKLETSNVKTCQEISAEEKNKKPSQCAKCGRDLSEGQELCPKCGAKIVKSY